MRTCTYIKHKVSKLLNSHADPVKHWGAWVLRDGTRKSNQGGLVPHKWGCTMSQDDGVGTPISEIWTAVSHFLSQLLLGTH